MKLLQDTSLKVKVAANFIGNLWPAFLNFIFTPFYLKYIGAEGYGLIGIFTSIQIMLAFLDGGLTITLNKELARLSVDHMNAQRMRNLVKTLGSIYWLIAVIAGIIATGLSPFLAHNWVKPNDLSVEIIQRAFILLSISIVFQFPSGFYSGGLLGLQRHVVLNILRVSFATLRSAGALCVLLFYSRSVTSFFGWILIVTVLQSIVFRWAVWHYLPIGKKKTIFDKHELKNIWRFAVGITSITIIAALLNQVDKIILSKSFTLEQMGYYTLTQTIAGMLVSFIVPTFTQSLFPKFNQLIKPENAKELKDIFMLNSRRISYILTPVSIFLCLFSYQLLLLYTKNETLSSNSYMTLSFFVIGFLINSTLHLPYNLALVFGHTKKIIRLYGLLLFIYIPLLFVSLMTTKIVNAAIAYCILQLVYLFLLIPLIQNKINFFSLKEWYDKVIIRPLFAAIPSITILYCLFSLTNLMSTPFAFILVSGAILGVGYLVIEKLYNLFGLFKKTGL